MNKKLFAAVTGALIAVGALGLAFGTTTGSAAEPAKQPPMMQPGQMGTIDPKAMADMMNSPEMQRQCVEMMKSPEMQQAMMGVMKQPEMQAAMKRMLQSDAGFHQMMLDLVNSVDMNMEHGKAPANGQTAADFDHGSHHR